MTYSKLDKILQILYSDRLCYRVPSFIKIIISGFIYWSKLLILSRITHFYVDIYIVKGNEKYSKTNLTAIYCGKKETLIYLCDLLYGNQYEYKKLRGSFISNLSRKLNKISQDMDIIFVKTDKLFAPLLRRKGFFILPEWIRMSLDISRPLNYIYDGFKKSAKEDIRKIKKYGYTYEFSTNLEKFEFFYHKIYLPYILRRHGKRTIESAVNYYEIRNLFERGKLMLVKMGERYVSGLIFRTEGDTAIALYTGVLSNPDYLSKAAGSALYYFFIEWAKKQGFIKIKFGGARPFLNDGTFQYKKKWGMKISISRMMPGIFGLKICNYESKATQSFLLHNPFLCIDKNRLKAMIFSHRKISDEESQKLRKKYYAPGMSDFEIVHLDKLS